MKRDESGKNWAGGPVVPSFARLCQLAVKFCGSTLPRICMAFPCFPKFRITKEPYSLLSPCTYSTYNGIGCISDEV